MKKSLNWKGLWLVDMERETGFEPATLSLGILFFISLFNPVLTEVVDFVGT